MYVPAFAIASGEMIASSSFFETKRVEHWGQTFQSKHSGKASRSPLPSLFAECADEPG